MSTLTNSTTRLTALVAGVAVALALMGAVAIAPAQAAGLSSSQVQAIVSLLASFGADSATIANVTAALNGQATTGNGGSAGACPVLTRSLSLGITGADVMSLQQFLNASADTRVSVSGAGSPGLETMYFGPATQAAVIKFQAKNNVSPIGVVGPATRAAIAAVCGSVSIPTNPTNPTNPSSPLNGGEADLRSFDLISGDDLMEGDSNKEIAIAEFDVKGGDAQVQRVTVDFQAISNLDNEHPWTYIDSLAVYNGNTKVGSVDASSKDDWDQNDADGAHNDSALDFYSIDIPVNTIVREDDNAELSIRATAQSSIDDSDESQTFAVQVPTDGIRAVDSKGIQQYTGEDGAVVTLGFDAAENGDLSVKLSSDTPDAGVLVADDQDTSDDFDVLKFEIKNSDDADADINGLTFTTAAGVTASNLVIRRATLTLDGKDYDGDISSSSIDFDDLSATVDGNDSIDGTLSVQLFGQSGHYTTSGEFITLSLANANVDAEGSDTGDASDVSGSANGKKQTITTEAGIHVTGSTMSASATEADVAANSYGTFTLKFNVTADGDDVFIPKAVASTTADNASTTSHYGIVVNPDMAAGSGNGVTASVTTTADSDTSNPLFYIVRDGDTETFTVSVRIDPTTTGFYQVGLDKIRFSTTDTNLNSLQLLDIDQTDSEFHTDSISITG